MILNREKIVENKELLTQSMKILTGLGSAVHTHIHILYVLKELMKEDCKTYLEIGIYRGMSMAITMQSKFPSVFYGIDGWNTTNANSSKSMALNLIKTKNIHNHPYSFIEGDSTDVNIINKTYESIKDGVDLFFIDGAHRDDYAYRDITNYFDLVNTDGIIAVDDYGSNSGGVVESIDRFCEEYKDKIHVIGLVENFVFALDAIGGHRDNNITFLIQKL